MKRAWLANVVILCSLAAAGVASAQTPEQIEKARGHYEKGLELYNEDNFEAALTEMERAYEIAPSYKIQYNLGRIHRQLNNYAAAIKAFETYLREGGTAVTQERRDEIEKELATLKTRVARLEIQTNVPDAEISVDDVPVGKTPITHTIVVNPGRRKVSATKPGFAPVSQVVAVTGTDAEVVRLNLIDLRREGPSDPGPRNRAIIAWSVSGAFTIAAVVFGVLALNENDKLKTTRDTFTTDPDALRATLNSQGNKVATYAILSDIGIGGAVLAGGFATYFTIRALRSDSTPPASASSSGSVKIGVGPGSVGIGGAF